jgi:hypothetical protein
MHLVALALSAAAAAAASASSSPHALLFGSFRDPLLQRQSRARALARGLPPAPDVTRLDYTGPVHGLGFVEHSHAAVARNTTLFLDDYSDILLRAACAAAAAPAPAAEGSPFLPDEAAAVARRAALAFTATLSAGPGASEAAHLLAGALAAGVGHVVLGASALAAAPSCAALVGDAAPVFALRGSTLSGGALTLALAPAALLEAFAGVRWSHRVTPDLDAALAERGETRAHYARQLAAAEYPTSGPGPIRRALVEGFLAFTPYVAANWDFEANKPVQESIALLSAAADFSGKAQVANASVGGRADFAAGVFCDNCFAYFRHGIVAQLEFCAYAAWSGSGLLSWAKIGIGPAGVGCNGEDQRAYDAIEGRAAAGYRLELGARYEASAGVGATLRAQLKASGALAASRMLYERPRLGEMTFYLASIPVTITIGASLALRVSLAGNFDALFVAGASVQARAALGFEYRNRELSPVRIWEFNQELTPPRASLFIGPSSLRFELVPALDLRIMGFLGFKAETPLRLQADLRYTAPDAVLCDFPRCDIPGTGMGPLYVTWQPRLRLLLAATRLHHVLGAVPYVGAAIAKLPMVPAELLLWPERELLSMGVTGRNALVSVCVPVDTVWTLSSGWAAAGSAARQLVLPAPEEGLQQAAEAGPRADRRSLATTCGGSSASGYWSGSLCSCEGGGALLFIGACCGCSNNFYLSCNAGYVMPYAGLSRSCSVRRDTSLWGCSELKQEWSDGGYSCRACRPGSYSSGGSSATSCTDCPAGRFASSAASSSCQLCAAGSYAQFQGTTACTPCAAGALCPAGSILPLSPSRTPSNTPTRSPTASVTPTRTASPTATHSGTGSGTTSPTPTPSGTGTASATSTPSLSATPSQTPTPSRTASPTSSPSATKSLGATASGTPTPSESPSGTGSPTTSPTPTPTPSGTASGTGTASPSTSATETPSGTGTATASQTGSPTATRTQTSSASRTPSGTPSFTPLTTPLPSCNRRPLSGDVPFLGATGVRATQAGADEAPAPPAPLLGSGLARVTRVSAGVLATLRLSGVPAPQGAAATAALADSLRVAAAAAAGLDAADLAVTVAAAAAAAAAAAVPPGGALTAILAWRVSAALVANLTLAEAAVAAGSAPTNASRADAAASRADAEDLVAMVEAAAAASASLLAAFAAGVPSGGYSPAALDCAGGSAAQQAMRVCAPWRAGKNATARGGAGANTTTARPGLRALAGELVPAADAADAADTEPFAGVPGFLLVLDAQVTASGGQPLDLAAANASVTSVQLSPASATARVVNASQVAEVLQERLPPLGLAPPPDAPPSAQTSAVGAAPGAIVGGAAGGAALLALAIGLALLARARARAPPRSGKLASSAEARAAAPVGARTGLQAFPAASAGGLHGAPQVFFNPLSALHLGRAAPLAPAAAAPEAPEALPMPVAPEAEGAAAGAGPAKAAQLPPRAAAPVDPLALARERRAASAGASAGGGAGPEARTPRSYRRLAAAETKLSSAEAAAKVGGLLHRVFRPRGVAMTEVYAALLVQAAWRRAKAYRARAHFAKVAAYDRTHPAPLARASGVGAQG